MIIYNTKTLPQHKRKKRGANKIKKPVFSTSSRHGNSKHENRREEKRYKTLHIDTNILVSVKIDHKTTVFVKPGTDIEKIKLQYTALRNKSKE